MTGAAQGIGKEIATLFAKEGATVIVTDIHGKEGALVALYCCEQGYQIRCNSIHPAAILTPLWDPMLGTGTGRETAIDTIAKDIPMKEMGMPEDVAYAALFLASDESKYITGIELTIDGGILAGASASPKKE
ncbi:MAG: SDR family oxidoreductase [Simkaniaceae bacterium]|nr:SDR family oxidoreductase [Candidatus Sacchlamyda saccharinae]